MDNSDDLYDQNPADDSGQSDKTSTDQTDTEDAGEPFLVPKSAFPENVQAGSTHTVRVDRILDTEIQVVCVGEDKSKTKPEATPAAADESSGMYD